MSDNPILVLGKDGQVGKSLQASELARQSDVIFLGRAEYDLIQLEELKTFLLRFKPKTIINAAAYTAVDCAESETELALRLNRDVPALLADYMAQNNESLLIHFSTDYVFSDTQPRAYLEDDVPGPAEQLSAYGRSKLLGEQQIHLAYRAAGALSNMNSRFYILRTSWVYGDGSNYIQKIWSLAHSTEQLSVVDDQFGIPSSSDWLANVCLALIKHRPDSGVYHAVPDGVVSRFGLAEFVLSYVQKYCSSVALKQLLPVSSKNYPMIAKRPQNSSMSNDKLRKVIPSLFEGQENTWTYQVKSYLDYLNEKHCSI